MEKEEKSSSNSLTFFLLTAIPIPILTVESKHNITSHEKIAFYTNLQIKNLPFSLNIYICMLLLPQVGERVFKCFGSKASK